MNKITYPTATNHQTSSPPLSFEFFLHFPWSCLEAQSIFLPLRPECCLDHTLLFPDFSASHTSSYQDNRRLWCGKRKSRRLKQMTQWRSEALHEWRDSWLWRISAWRCDSLYLSRRMWRNLRCPRSWMNWIFNVRNECLALIYSQQHKSSCIIWSTVCSFGFRFCDGISKQLEWHTVCIAIFYD